MRLLLALLAFALLPCLAAAQGEATPTPETAPAETAAAAIAEAPAAALVPLSAGQEAVFTKPVIVPASAKPEEVAAIAGNAAEAQRAVASGEVPVEKATRSLRDLIDLGSEPLLFLVLALILGAVVRPPLNAWVKGHPKIDNDTADALHVGAFVVLYTVAWAALHSSRPELPQDWEGWMVMGATSVLGGTATHKYLAKVIAWAKALGESGTRP
jgi:hypothetical protein